MKKLDLYLLRKFISFFTVSLFSLLIIFIVVDMVDNLDKFIDSSISVKTAIGYYAYSLPWFINLSIPIAAMIATIFTIGILSRRNEITAMKAAGISLYRLALPLLAMAVIISAGSFGFENTIVSSANKERRIIEKEILKKSRKEYRERRRDIFFQKSNNFHIAIEHYFSRNDRGMGITMQFLNQGVLVKRIDAQHMTWLPDSSGWKLHNYAVRTFSPEGVEQNMVASSEDTLVTIEFTPDDIKQEAISPEERNFGELKTFIAQLKNNGVDTTRWEVNLHFKLAFAFTTFIVILFAIPLVAANPKGGMTFGAGTSVLVIFVYYAFIRFGQSLGYQGILTPFLSAWVGNIIFSLGGLLLLVTVRK